MDRTTDQIVAALLSGELDPKAIPDAVLADLVDVLMARQNEPEGEACIAMLGSILRQCIRTGDHDAAKNWLAGTGFDIEIEGRALPLHAGKI